MTEFEMLGEFLDTFEINDLAENVCAAEVEEPAPVQHRTPEKPQKPRPAKAEPPVLCGYCGVYRAPVHECKGSDMVYRVCENCGSVIGIDKGERN